MMRKIFITFLIFFSAAYENINAFPNPFSVFRKKTFTYEERLQFAQALRKGLFRDVKAFLDKGMPFNEAVISQFAAEETDSKSGMGNFPLHEAALYKRFDIVKLLLDRGASVVAKNNVGQAPLFLLCSCNDYTCFQGSSESGRMCSILYGKGSHFAHDMKEIRALCTLMLSKGADVNARDKDRESALYAAISKTQDFSLVEFLINHGATVKIKDKYGNTPLHAATDLEVFSLFRKDRSDIVAIVTLLLQKGADVNALNASGETPLHSALDFGTYERSSKLWEKIQYEVVSLLLKNGAQTDIMSKIDNLTPLGYAIEHQSLPLVKLLLQHGASVSFKKGLSESAYEYVLNHEYNKLKQDGTPADPKAYAIYKEIEKYQERSKRSLLF